MKWWKFWSRDKYNQNPNNGILGPKHLENFAEIIPQPKKIRKYEWRRKLKSTAGNYHFKIKFYGQLHSSDNPIIVDTDFAPPKIMAIDIHTKEEILLYDGCIHGYDAMTWMEFSEEQISQRVLDKFYKDKKGNEIFKIILSAYYQIDYENEFRQEVDEYGKIEIRAGEKIHFEDLKRNGCDFMGINGINKSGDVIEILAKEVG